MTILSISEGYPLYGQKLAAGKRFIGVAQLPGPAMPIQRKNTIVEDTTPASFLRWRSWGMPLYWDTVTCGNEGLKPGGKLVERDCMD